MKFLTRVDEDGIPCIVQQFQYDALSHSLRVLYFDEDAAFYIQPPECIEEHQILLEKGDLDAIEQEAIFVWKALRGLA